MCIPLKYTNSFPQHLELYACSNIFLHVFIIYCTNISSYFVQEKMPHPPLLIAVGSSILGTSLFGLSSLFPSKYMQATMTGQAMGGLFAAIANLATLSIGSHVVDSGLGFFLFATFMSICTLMGYCLLYCIVSNRCGFLYIVYLQFCFIDVHFKQHVNEVFDGKRTMFYISCDCTSQDIS